MSINRSYAPAVILLFLIILSSFVLSSSIVSADDSVVDDVSITVPTSCTMRGTGMNSHNATINNGTYNSEVGTTTLRAFCNDNDGFAIYAIGYTNNTDGNTVLASQTLGSNFDIATGTQTSGNSQWAMKLATDSNATYPIELQNGFGSFHTIPDDYTLVAKRTAGTDIDTGESATGTTLTTTYQVYISNTQSADTYIGKVKYVMVHPNYVDSDALKDAVTVIFDGNDLTFPNGQTTNTVKYAKVCKPGGYGYVANTPYTTVGTSNLNSDGTQKQESPSYTDSENILQTITVPNADKVKVVVDYGITDGVIIAIKGAWDGNSEPDEYQIIVDDYEKVGTGTAVLDGNEVTLFMNVYGVAPEPGYDYGAYFKIYAVYDTEQPGATGEELPSNDCSIVPISGTYAETNPWKGKWTTEIPTQDCYWDDELQEDVCTPGGTYTADIIDEYDLSNSLFYEYESLKGTTITLSAYNPYSLIYNGNGASNEFGMGVHEYYASSGYNYQFLQEFTLDQEITLLAPNYKRTGYGFIGWSLDQNAASHLSTANLYGPNETITIDQNMINSANNSHEITMYAIWLPSAGNLQGWSGCSSMSVGDVTALTDTRDNDTYAVAKLADGNCWMIENLRLGGDNPITLTTADTQSAGTLPAATYGEDWINVHPVQQISNINMSSLETVVENINQNNYAFGNYYSWYAATNLSEAITSSVNSMTSICPVGWKLPSDSEYRSLYLMDQIDPRLYPNNFVLGGFISHHEHGTFTNYKYNGYGKKVIGRAQGLYWTSSGSKSNTFSYTSYGVSDNGGSSLGSGYNPSYYGTDGSQSEGYTVRCVLSNAN
ncbi:hypothetical protein J6V85_03840 [Candidatus Saccharibacteria bacterium]|nr:hypothetical protein [Candidatus Saccharibacteria bacterium]